MSTFGRLDRSRDVLVALVLALAGALPLAAFEVVSVARWGEPAPGFDPGAYIDGFEDPPSINDAGYAVIRVVVSPGDVQAIYRWHELLGLELVAKGTDQVTFATGLKTLASLETPIVDDHGWVAFTATLSDGGRGMAVWEPGGPLHPVAEVGQNVSIQCETTTGSPCDPNPVTGTLQTMATFFDRKAAIFRRYFESEHKHELLFAGTLTAPPFGSPHGLFRWAIDDDGTDETFYSVASSLVHYPGGSSTTYFNAFTNLAACGIFRYAFVGISTNPPLGVIDVDWTGGNDHLAVDRHYTVDTVVRGDLHCTANHYGWIGARSNVPSDHTQTLRGAFIDTGQVYSVTQIAPGLGGVATLGQPLGEAFIRDDAGKIAFAAKVVGGGQDGSAGVWVGGTTGSIENALAEQTGYSFGTVEQIYAALVHEAGKLVYHVKLVGGQFAVVHNWSQSYIPRKILKTGDQVPDGQGGHLFVVSFSTLGSTPADPVVTGGGRDGILGAVNEAGQLAMIVETSNLAAPQRGTSTPGMFVVELGLFTDDFESEDVCAWSGATGAAAC